MEKKFIEVEIADYVIEGIASEKLVEREAEKTARIAARQGIVGEKIVTVLADGTEETVNFVKENEETGKVDWVVTNPGGEQYIVDSQTFEKKYETDLENPGIFKPKGGPVKVAQIHENISFDAPWGEKMKISNGGYLVLAEDGIYGINPDEFNSTYALNPVQENEKVNEK